MTAQPAAWLRLLPPVLMLVVTGAFLYSRSRPELLPRYQQMSGFPMQIGAWQGSDAQIPENVRASLGKGEFLQRRYWRSATEPPVDLFLAFFPSQTAGVTVHSPQHCLPGSGWSPIEHGFVRLRGLQGAGLTVNRYIVARAGNRDFVLYWYQSHGRAIADEYWGKFYLVEDAIRLNRTDGGLVRIVTPLGQNEGIPEAQQRAVLFAEAIIPQLTAYIPN